MIPKEKIEAWKRLHKEAWPGPWGLWRGDGDTLEGDREYWCTIPGDRDTTLLNQSTAEFIAVAYNDAVPALIEENEQLRARVEELRRYVDGREKAILTRITAEELAGNTVQEDMERTALGEIREIQTLLLPEPPEEE